MRKSISRVTIETDFCEERMKLYASIWLTLILLTFTARICLSLYKYVMCLDTLVQFMILCRHRAYRKVVNPVSVMFFLRCFDSFFRLYYYRSSEKRLLLEVYGKGFFHDERGRTESILSRSDRKKEDCREMETMFNKEKYGNFVLHVRCRN